MRSILFAIIFISNFTFAQIKSGKITYSLVLTEDKQFLSNETFGPMYKIAIENARKVHFTLNFSTTESYFEIDNFLNSSDSNSDLAKSFCDYSGPIFTNIIDKQTLQNSSENIFPKYKYIITEKLQNDWKMSSETKMIDNYLCYKAETFQIVKNSEGTFKHPVVAWYCPKLPISSGPLGYGNLPGLILELQVRNAIFGAIALDLNPIQPVKIIKPLKGKTISMDNYNLMISKMATKNFHRE